MSTPTAAPKTASAAPLPERLEILHRNMVAQRKQVERAIWLTSLVGLIALVIMSCYFIYGYVQIANFLEPKNLIDTAEGILDERMPEARNALAENIVKSSPEWAQSLSRQIRDGIPDARRHLEDSVLEAITSQLKEGEAKADAEFRSFLEANKSLIESHLKELSKNPKLAEASLKDIEVALEGAVAVDMQVTSKEMFKNLNSLIVRMKKLRTNKELTHEENLERRVVMLARRLQIEKVGEDVSVVSPFDQGESSDPAVESSVTKGKSASKKETPTARAGKKPVREKNMPAPKVKKEKRE